MMIREPAVAGTFFPSAAEECRRALIASFEASVTPPVIDGRIVAGLVPHAGWVCSGKVTAAVVTAISRQRSPATFVVLGAVHRLKGPQAAVFAGGRWELPGGSIEIDERLAERVMGYTNLIVDDAYAHEAEHSIEVQVPFIQHVFPEAKLLPIMVPPTAHATEVGQAVARTLQAYDYDAVVLASSDLTHYGRRYAFAPHGEGVEGVEWAKNVNDRRLIDLLLKLDADAVVPEAAKHRNACGAGAIAAAMSAAQSLGADTGVLLDHTTSYETVGPDPGNNAVGYAGVVFTAP